MSSADAGENQVMFGRYAPDDGKQFRENVSLGCWITNLEVSMNRVIARSEIFTGYDNMSKHFHIQYRLCHMGNIGLNIIIVRTRQHVLQTLQNVAFLNKKLTVSEIY